MLFVAALLIALCPKIKTQAIGSEFLQSRVVSMGRRNTQLGPIFNENKS